MIHTRGGVGSFSFGSPLRPVTWCSPKTETYLRIVLKALCNSQLIVSVLSPASDAMTKQIFSKAGDGPIPHGLFEESVGGMLFRAMNADNHQLTWGVLKAAIDGLHDYFVSTGKWGVGSFDIYDGQHKVGTASLSGPV